MIKKALIGLGSIVLALVIVGLIPISSLVKDQTASDTIVVVGSIFVAVTLYKLLSSKFIK